MAQVQGQILPTSQASNIVPEPVRDGIDLHINGEHYQNGADLILLGDKAVSATTLSMSSLADKSVTTVEGLAANDGTLHPLQQAFIDEDAIGCGYCTPGWLISGVALLRRKPKAGDDDIDQLPNLCRCGCQTRVRHAIKRDAAGKAAQP